MATVLPTRIANPFSNLLKRPLNAAEFAIVAGGMLILGTIYCQLWCLIALQKLHGGTMPLDASVLRAFLDIVPALGAFELSKRVSVDRRGALASIVVIFVIALCSATALRMTMTVMTSDDPSIRVLAAHRLGPLGVSALALFWYFAQRGREVRRATSRAILPPARTIEWVRAAGNYVEVRFAGRTQLVRMTLRQAVDELPREQFVQVHRSAIVNRSAIAGQHGRRKLRMSDGTEIAIGDAFRSNLGRP